MADIYQIPENGSGNGNIPFSIPIGNGGGMFGGCNSLVDLFGFAIIASMFGWNNGGFGGFGGGAGGAGFLSNQLNNDSGRELIMNAVTSQGEASRTAIQNLASAVGQDFNIVNTAVGNVQNMLSSLSTQFAMSVPQIIGAIQSGDAAVTSAFQQCCCENRLALSQLGNSVNQGFSGVQQAIASKSAADQLMCCQTKYDLTTNANAGTQAILGKLSEMQTQALQDKLDAARNENTRLAGEISQAQQNNAIAGMISSAVNPLVAQLAGIRSEVDAIKRCQPPTITLPNNQYTAVPTLVANAGADFIASYWANRLSQSTTPATDTTTGA